MAKYLTSHIIEYYIIIHVLSSIYIGSCGFYINYVHMGQLKDSPSLVFSRKVRSPLWYGLIEPFPALLEMRSIVDPSLH